MTTKEQERKALEKIRKIVKELGDNSYIGIAFEGCFEIAEENIENDFGCSMKSRAEAAEKDAKRIGDLYKEANDLLDARTNLLDKKNVQIEILNKQYDSATLRIAELNDQIYDAGKMLTAEMDKTFETEKKIKEQEQEIIKLKAKLYDMMIQNS